MATLITNIRQLVNVRTENPLLRGPALASLPIINNAFVVVEGDQIAACGPMESLSHPPTAFSEHVDAGGGTVLPAWCDSHSHLVFAGSREAEFVDKINGLGYAEIAAKGGGILASAERLNQTSEDELFRMAWQRLHEVGKMGTGAIEIKSGYGLTVEGELKMLRVIRRLKQASRITIKATFLGAHALPLAYKNNREGYLALLLNEMLPRVAAEGLADYVDVFCETGFFSAEETERICAAARGYGLKPKLHVNQLNSIGGIEAGIRQGAISLDHLETMTASDIQHLAGAPSTVATLLPSAAFFLRMPYQPARQLIEAGSAVALASDYNPGSSPSGNMNFVVSLACIQLRMQPEEAINAATLNGAHALELGEELGSIAIGKRANLLLTKPIPSLAYLPYSFGNNLVSRVMVGGDWLTD